jgi:hypothetical protein
MNRFARLALVTVLVGSTLGFVACASIMHGSSQELNIASQPSGASVAVDNLTLGRTPLVAKLKRKDKHAIAVTLDGYQPFELTTTRSTSGWVWGNILFGGLIGLAVDLSTGGAYKINPEQVNAALVQAHASATFTDGTLYVVLVRTPDPSWQKIGQMERR